MAKFIYRMQNILDIKYKMEAQAKTSYAMASAKLKEAGGKLEQLIIGKRELEDEYRRLAKGKIDPLKLSESRYAIDFQKEKIKAQLVEVRVAEKNLEIARARLNEMMKDRKTHEKLREHAFNEFLVEINEQEKREIDELVSYRFGAAKEEGR